MDIKLNGLVQPSSLITFNHIPTILEVDSSYTKAIRWYIKINVGKITQNDMNNIDGMVLTIDGNSITFTNDINKAKNNIAYLTLLSDNASIKGMTYYLVQALNNTQLTKKYNIFTRYDEEVSQLYGTTYSVIIEAKNVGLISMDSENDNMPVSTWTITKKYENEVGTWTDSDWANNPQGTDDALTNSKVLVDVYINDDERTQDQFGGVHTAITNKVATLEKSYYKDGIKFDLAPVLSNYTDNGKLIEYDIEVSSIANGQLTTLGRISHNYAVNGYLVNNGNLFIEMSYPQYYIAQNHIAENGDYMSLYYYDNITFSLYIKSLEEKVKYTVIEYNSAYEAISQKDFQDDATSSLMTIEYVPDNEEAYYIGIVIPSVGSLMYTNVKPLKYGNSNEVTTLYWNNSYGGVSFFPFTASKVEERDVKNTTYKKSSLDLYNDAYHRSSNKIYKKSHEYTITVKSHYIPKKGIGTLYDLQNSYNAWVYNNGIKYDVIISSIKIDEISTGIYQATCEFTYSSNDEL